MGFQPEDVKDLVALTQNDLPKQELEYAFDHNEYFWANMFETDAIKIDGGTQIERKVSFDRTGNAKYRSMYELDDPQIADHIHTITVHWALIGTNASWDEFEILQQKNSEKGFISLIQTKRDEAIIDLADLIEETMIAVPESATDRKHPFTLPYFLRVLNSAGDINTTAGFNGTTVLYGNGTKGTIVAGIDAATEEKWRNYLGPYTTIDTTFLKVARKAFIKTKFRKPILLNSPLIKERALKMRAIAGTDTVLDLMELVDKRDDNHVATNKETLGGMLVADGDLVRLNRVPVLPLDTLDDASYDPIYFFDLSYLVPFVHDGYWMVKKDPMIDRGQHTTYTSFIDGAHNVLPKNMQRLGFVLHKTG